MANLGNTYSSTRIHSVTVDNLEIECRAENDRPWFDLKFGGYVDIDIFCATEADRLPVMRKLAALITAEADRVAAREVAEKVAAG